MKFNSPLTILLLLISSLSTLYTPTINSFPNSNLADITGSPIQFTETSSYLRFNNTMFVIEFYKASSGYNKIYNINNEVLVYDERVTLEYLSGSNWKQRGVPINVSYTKLSDYSYDVTRNYSDYLGTTYSVVYNIRADSPIKSTIILNSAQTSTYRIAWSPSGITQASSIPGDNLITFGSPELDNKFISFDWGDVYYSIGDITTTSISTVANGKKLNIYFNIGIIPSGSHISIDPSTIGTSASFYAVYCAGRKILYFKGVWWAFYSDNTNMVYKTSSDGINWSASSTLRAGVTRGYYMSITWDGTYLHSAFAAVSALYYRAATVANDLTLSWVAAEVQINTDGNVVAYPSGMTVDSTGHVWIGYRGTVGDNVYPYVVMNSDTDGTWTTAAGFPYKLKNTASTAGWFEAVVTLDSGKVGVIYALTANVLYGRIWDGDSWGAEGQTTSTIENGAYLSVVGRGDDIDVVWLEAASYDIMYSFFDYDTNDFGAETEIYAAAQAASGPALCEGTVSTDLYCFWAGDPTASHIYYKKFDRSAVKWDDNPTDFVNEAVAGMVDNNRLTCTEFTWAGNVGVMYMINTATYTIRFATLATADEHLTVTTTIASTEKTTTCTTNGGATTIQIETIWTVVLIIVDPLTTATQTSITQSITSTTTKTASCVTTCSTSSTSTETCTTTCSTQQTTTSTNTTSITTSETTTTISETSTSTNYTTTCSTFITSTVITATSVLSSITTTSIDETSITTSYTTTCLTDSNTAYITSSTTSFVDTDTVTNYVTSTSTNYVSTKTITGTSTSTYAGATVTVTTCTTETCTTDGSGGGNNNTILLFLLMAVIILVVMWIMRRNK